MKKKILVIEDGHINELGAVVAPRDNFELDEPVIIASRTTSKVENRYS